jgi:adenylosuccinate lyase
MALGRAGADRQAMHERLRQHALAAWEAIQMGEANPLPELICDDPVFLTYLRERALLECCDVSRHLGDAPQRARRLAAEIRGLL